MRDRIMMMALKLSSYKGTRDLYPRDMELRRYVFDGWRKAVESYGYQEYMAPLLEPVDVYSAKSGEEIVNDQTYSFTDRGGRQMVIRPEMTPSVARMVAARRQEMPMPARLYSIANFMRYERPQHGREREFWQLNFDLFGDDSIYADAEIIEIAGKLLHYFGATEEMFTIKVGDRRLTDFIMREYLTLDDETAGRIIKLLDKFDKMSREKFDAAATELIGTEKLGRLGKIIEAKSLDDLPPEVASSEVTKPLRRLLEIVGNEQSWMRHNVHYDPRLMRGFDYYTGIVFEVFDEAPENRRSLFGGGRYDGLVGLFGVEPLPVVGAAPGETMFIEFLRAHDLIPQWAHDGVQPATVTYRVIPLDNQPLIAAFASKIAEQLRQLALYRDIAVSIDHTARKPGAKTKAAIKTGIDYIVYIGESEVRNHTISVKNTTTGDQTVYNVTSSELTDMYTDARKVKDSRYSKEVEKS